MALTTVARVRELGGIDDANAYQLFRLASDAALVARVQAEIDVQAAWLRLRAGADYASGNADKDKMFAEAEAWLALQSLFETLKARKVHGTHWPLEQEGSDRFEALIDVEIPRHISKFVEQYLVIETDQPFAAPAIVFGAAVDRTKTHTAEQELGELLHEANALTDPTTTWP